MLRLAMAAMVSGEMETARTERMMRILCWTIIAWLCKCGMWLVAEHWERMLMEHESVRIAIPGGKVEDMSIWSRRREIRWEET